MTAWIAEAFAHMNPYEIIGFSLLLVLCAIVAVLLLYSLIANVCPIIKEFFWQFENEIYDSSWMNKQKFEER